MAIQATPAQPKQRNKRRYGVKIKNPLSLPVSVILKSATGALRPGAVDGKETSRQIDPGGEIFVSTKGSCELDVDIAIIRFDPDGRKRVVGHGDFRCTDHRDATGGKSKKTPVTSPIKLTGTLEVPGTETKYLFVGWQLDQLREGRLLKVIVDMQPLDPGSYGRAWIELRDRATGKKVRPAPENFKTSRMKMTRSTTLDFKREVLVPPGHDVAIVGWSSGGRTKFTGTIIGEEWPAIAQVPTREPQKPAPKPVEEEEVEIRSLGDMLRDHAKEEVPA